MTAEQLGQRSPETDIVLLSDDPVSARLLKQILAHRRYQVREVGNVPRLRSAVTKQRPDLVLLDVVAPGEDTYALCQEMNSDDATSWTPVIFVSAFQQSVDKVRAFEVGGADYLTKPFHPAEVLARVDHHLKHARLQRELAQEKLELQRKYEELRMAHQRISLMSMVLTEQLAGHVLDGKYLVQQKLDSGGFGVVYRAQHLTLQRPVAIKILRPVGTGNRDSHLERFRREGISACRVNHKNAVAVLDSGVSPEGILYLVMELLNGHSLQARLDQHGGLLPTAECLRIIEPVCAVLAEAHAAGVVHRDIKPGNIFLHEGPTGEDVKVLDFGIARLRGEEDRTLTRLTHPDAAIGTALYMAPERLHDGFYDGKSDVYSLAVMLYIMLCGCPPFAVNPDDLMSTMFCNYFEPPILLRAKNPSISPELEKAVMRGLAKDPQERPTALQFRSELRAASSACD